MSGAGALLHLHLEWARLLPLPKLLMSAKEVFRPSILRHPRYASETGSWHGHIPFAFWCVDTLGPQTFVELGCHRGDSYLAFCQAVDELGLTTRCYAVDTWQGDPHAGEYGGEIYEELKRYHDPRYGRFSRLVRSTFDQARDQFADGSVDLLHIDGFHEYEAVKHDLESWLPKVSARGVVLLHDIDVREAGFGVARLWEEVRCSFPSFAFLHSHGLGVLAVGPEAPEAVRVLTKLGDQDQGEVRALFARLGDAVGYEVQNRRLQKSLTEHEAELARAAEYVQKVERSLGEHREEAARLGDYVGALKTALAGHEAEAARLRDELTQMRASLSWRMTRPLRWIRRTVRSPRRRA